MSKFLKNIYNDCKNKELHKIFEKNSITIFTFIGKYIGLCLGYGIEYTIIGIDHVRSKMFDYKNDEDIIMIEHENDINL